MERLITKIGTINISFDRLQQKTEKIANTEMKAVSSLSVCSKLLHEMILHLSNLHEDCYIMLLWIIVHVRIVRHVKEFHILNVKVGLFLRFSYRALFK
jgi:hypothetical protein